MNFKELVEKELDPKQVIKALSGDKTAKEDLLTQLVDKKEEKKEPEQKRVEVKKGQSFDKNNDPIKGNKQIKPSLRHSNSGSINKASWLN